MKRKIVVFFTFLLVIVTSVCFVSCNTTANTTISADHGVTLQINREEGSSLPKEVVITIGDEEPAADATLYSVMQELKDANSFAFSFGGEGYYYGNLTLTSILGRENNEQNKTYWRLYTTDTTYSNQASSTYTYDGKVMGIASANAMTIKAKSNQTYVWVYQTVEF